MSSTGTRTEKDTMGTIEVPADKLWGAQTQRSLTNFNIGIEQMPIELIRAFAILKIAAAHANKQLGVLEDSKADAIIQAAEEVRNGQWDEHFPLRVWQTGSGTQSNMNVNEVLARRANQMSELNIHPNDDVNRSQSSNDTFPTAMHIAAIMEITQVLIPAISDLKETFFEQSMRYTDIIKIGRTHLQDATPLTFGQEISGWFTMLEEAEIMIELSLEHLRDLAIGGTAVGTGLNAPAQFGEKTADEISRITGQHFRSSRNKFHALTSHDAIVYAHGALKALAANVMKIANDVRWLSSGPRSGLGEITIPENEPGSSIMPGKVNPTQSEALTMIACQVMGNDMTIGVAASQGNFELNVFKPVIIYNFLQSVRLLADGIRSFNQNCAIGIKPNTSKMEHFLNNSLMLVTALNPHIGYEKAASIAKQAHKEGLTLKEAALRSGLVTEEQFEAWVQPANMVN